MTAATTAPTTPAELRALAAAGRWTGPTAGLFGGYQQANLVVVPQAAAYDFLLFCVRNPTPCPLLGVGDTGDPVVTVGDTRVDVRTDFPRYRTWHHGVDDGGPTDLRDRWREDSVAFLLGCSHTFEEPLERAGVPVRRNPESAAPAVYVTTRPTVPAGRVHGPLVVSMRAVPAALVDRAREVTARYPTGHGAPVHVGDPAALGIADLAAPDFGPAPVVEDGDVPVFWGCGVTPQLALPGSGAEYVFTHAAGHMVVLDHSVDAAATAGPRG
ncbi:MULTISPECIES: D-glutamate cyclase family protein [unclassified Pseudonocardia]|uniref:D-glutamate cyclase family protein n=1 Tax=unclassified Pseudonocardia TaxID=2619320 RepID=UPI001CF7026B|nr:DUF1445 domain-containing protein [Pseudonocardia sp. ICBG601]